MKDISYLQQHRKTKPRIMLHAVMDYACDIIGNLQRQCGLADRTPDGKAWDLVSIPSCITVRDLARDFSLCLSYVKVLTIPTLTFLHRYDIKVYPEIS